MGKNFDWLEVEWSNPIPGERKIFQTKVIEMFATRLVFLGFIAFVCLIVAYYLNWYWLVLVPNLILALGFPIFFNPWDIILSDKRLILRKRYWYSGRLSRITSVNLSHVESQRYSPRLKVIPITVGFFVIESFSLILIQYGLTQTPPLPLVVELLLLIGRLLGIIEPYTGDIIDVVNLVYAPFLPIALLAGIITLAIGFMLILFGLPYRTSFMLYMTNGNTISINAGVPKKLTTLIFSVSRSREVVTKVRFWDLNVPLLDGESVKSSAKVALVNHRTQFVGFLSLYLLVASLTHLASIENDINLLNIVLWLTYMLNVIVIIFALRFAKRYRQIVATSERLLFQDEYTKVSGLWGRRLYQYTDLPHRFIQGFEVENYNSISIFSVAGALLMVLTGLLIADLLADSKIFVLIAVALPFYLVYNYKTKTSYNIKTVGGKVLRVNYNIPVIWGFFSKHLEHERRLYNFLFYNILSNRKIAKISNSIRGVKEVKRKVPSKGKQSLGLDNFLDSDEEIVQSWSKLKPVPYLRATLLVGTVGSLVWLTSIHTVLNINDEPFWLGVLLGALLLGVIITRSFVVFRRTLIITSKRVFFIKELRPKTGAFILGKLPEWTLVEVVKRHIELTKLRLYFPTTKFFTLLRNVILLFTFSCVLAFRNEYKLILPNMVVETITVISVAVSAALVLLLIIDLVASLPRYSLLVQLRFGTIEVPYISHFKGINSLMTEITEKKKYLTYASY